MNMDMDEAIEKNFMNFLSNLEQAEGAAFRNGKFNEFVALGQLHLIALHFYTDETEAINSLTNNIGGDE